MAEDNPVISCYGNNSLNQAGTMRSCSARDKLPESTGDKLAAWGDMSSNFAGEAGLDSSGGGLNCGGVIPLDVEIPPENNL